MADTEREIRLPIVATDRTGAATRSAGNNFDKLKRKVDGLNDTSSAATKGIRGMAESFVQASSTLRAGGPYVAIAAILGALTALPAAGSLAAGALVSVLGGGLVAIGVLAAAQNEKVRRAFGDTLAYIRSVAPQFGAPFVPVLTKLAERIRSTFILFAPELTKSMQTLAPVIDRFLGNIQAGVMQLRPIIGPVTQAFAALVDAVGPQVPVIMNQLAVAINRVAASIRENPQTFATLIALIGKMIVMVVNLTAALSKLANMYQRHPALLKAQVAAINPAIAAHLLFGRTVVRVMQDISAAVGNMVAGFGRHIAGLLRTAAKGADAIGMDGAAKKLRATASAIEASTRGIQNSINSLTGKTVTVRVNTVYKVYKPKNSPGAGFGGAGLMLDSAAGWMSAAAGSFTTGGPAPVVNVAAPDVTTTVLIDGQEVRAIARTVVGEQLGRSATRAKYGRTR